MKRFLLSCGGTGGHLSPGIALAEGLAARGHRATLLISNKKIDARLIEKYPHLEFVRIPGAPFTLKPWGLVRFFTEQTKALFLGFQLVRTLKPDGIIGFGGFTTASVIVAGALSGVPVALHEANRVPGRAIRLLGRLARRVYLPPGVELHSVRASVIRAAGLPVRKEIVREDREMARKKFGLDPQRTVLVVLGGSQGATPLNDWAMQKAEALAHKGIQLICVTGPGKTSGTNQPASSGAEAGGAGAVYLPFCDQMGSLISAADLVVSRAGAGTLAELVRCQTPAILVPYPHAADNHQAANAAFFEKQGGGLVVSQDHLGDLTREVQEVIFNDWLLGKFRANLERMDQANLLDQLLDDLEGLTTPPPSSAHGQMKTA